MFINSINVNTIAGTVWTNATRTLTADPATPTAVSGRTTVATATVVDLRPSGASFRRLTVVSTTQVAQTQYGVYDGTNFDLTADGTTPRMPYSGFGNVTRGMAFQQTSGASATYAYCGWDVT